MAASNIEFTHRKVNLASLALPAGAQPMDVITRQTGEQWYVLFEAQELNTPAVWRLSRRGDAVGVPLIPYYLPADPASALANMALMGLRCACDFGRPLRRVHVATGYPAEQCMDERRGLLWHYRIGIAVMVADGVSRPQISYQD